MESKEFIKPTIDIITLHNNDIIVTSPGISLPDDEWTEEQ